MANPWRLQEYLDTDKVMKNNSSKFARIQFPIYCPGVAVGTLVGAIVGVPLIIWVSVIGVVGVGVSSGVAAGVSVLGSAVGCGVGGRRKVTVTFGAGSASRTPAGS
jgi:hypothetical protein